MKCECCGEETGQNKNGKTKSGSQRYICKHCGKTYTPEKKERQYPKEIREKAIRLFLDGKSSRTIARVLGIGKNTALYWVKKYTENIKSKPEL